MQLRIFNRLLVLDNKISVSDIDGMKILKLYEHPEIRPQIEVIKTSVLYETSLQSPMSHINKDMVFENREGYQAVNSWNR